MADWSRLLLYARRQIARDGNLSAAFFVYNNGTPSVGFPVDGETVGEEVNATMAVIMRCIRE